MSGSDALAVLARSAKALDVDVLTLRSAAHVGVPAIVRAALASSLSIYASRLGTDTFRRGFSKTSMRNDGNCEWSWSIRAWDAGSSIDPREGITASSRGANRMRRVESEP